MLLLSKEQQLKLKDIANFFDISDSSIRNPKMKERYLSKLCEYCDYEIVYSKSGKQVSHYLVKEVYNEGPYESKKELREKVIKFYQEEWGKDDEKGGYIADSPSVLTSRFCSENGIPWSMPHSIYVEDDYTNDRTGRKKRIVNVTHNPEAKRWWQIYGIINRQIRKDIAEGKYIPNRIWLLRKGDLHIARPTEEETKIIETAAEKCFGQKHIGPQEAKELVEYLVRLEKQEKFVSIEDLSKRFPFLAHVKDNNRWEIFNQLLAGMGINETVRGSEHKKDQIGELLNQVKIENKEDYYYEF